MQWTALSVAGGGRVADVLVAEGDALLAALLTARQAARLQIVQALRYE
ncbi:MAG: hypothetical protein ACUVX9_13565 [Anaerolineae bacterium]